MGHDWTILGITGQYGTLLDNIGHYWKILDITGQYGTLLDNMKESWTVLSYAMKDQAIVVRNC